MQVVREGDKVQVHYVKRFHDGCVLSSQGRPPTEVTVGIAHPRLPGLGLALVGLTVGETRIVRVPARHAYGPHQPGRVHSLPSKRFARYPGLSAGQWVRVRGGRQRRLVRIVEVRENVVVVDANHRWAGQSLELEVDVLAIRGPEDDAGPGHGPEVHTPDPPPDLR